MTAVVLVGTILFACIFAALTLFGRSIGENLRDINQIKKDLPNLHGRIDTLQEQVDELRQQIKSSRLT